MTLPGGVMIFSGGMLARRTAAVPSAIARSRSPLARQITTRWISGEGKAGLSRIAWRLLGITAVLIGVGLVRIELDRHVVVGDRPGEISLGFIGIATVVIDDA